MKKIKITDFKNKFIAIMEHDNDFKNGLLVINGQTILDYEFNMKNKKMERLEGVFGSVLIENKDLKGEKLLTAIEDYFIKAQTEYEKRLNSTPKLKV